MRETHTEKGERDTHRKRRERERGRGGGGGGVRGLPIMVPIRQR